jgi:hypothetical protein
MMHEQFSLHFLSFYSREQLTIKRFIYDVTRFHFLVVFIPRPVNSAIKSIRTFSQDTKRLSVSLTIFSVGSFVCPTSWFVLQICALECNVSFNTSCHI